MNMIPVSTPLLNNKNEPQSWQKDVSNNFKQLDELLNFLDINKKDAQKFYQHKTFPIKITQFYANLIQKNDPNDPLLLQVIPQTLEQQSPDGYKTDAVGDLSAIKYPGLIHKYQGRALLSLTAACGIHCRYCFRRSFPYSDNTPDLSANSELMKYLKKNCDIHEVILSGGDPLMLSDKKLNSIMQSLDAIQHIKTVRFHTRMPSILPNRITSELLNRLSISSKHIVFVLHINHPNEINKDVMRACQKLKSINITLLNQSVLLKDVNDSSSVLKGLSNALFDAGILPYYLHCLDKVKGVAHFDTPRKTAKKLMVELKKQLPGYLIPKLVEEIAGESSKTHIL